LLSADEAKGTGGGGATLAVVSEDGIRWTYRSTVASNVEGHATTPAFCASESATLVLDGSRIFAIFRPVVSGYGFSVSDTNGRTFSAPALLPGDRSNPRTPHHVEPKLALVGSPGVVVLSGGRPGVFLWSALEADLQRSVLGTAWAQANVLEAHNRMLEDGSLHYADCVASAGNCSAGVGPQTTSYTGLTTVGKSAGVVCYDQIAFGWVQSPTNSFRAALLKVG